MENYRVIDKLNFKSFMENIYTDVKPSVYNNVIHVYKYDDISVDNIVIMIFVKESDSYVLYVCMADGSRFDIPTIGTFIYTTGVESFIQREDVILNSRITLDIDILNDNFISEITEKYKMITSIINSFLKSNNIFIERYLTEHIVYDTNTDNILDSMSVNYARAILQHDITKLDTPIFIRMNCNTCSAILVKHRNLGQMLNSIVIVYVHDNSIFEGSDYMYNRILKDFSLFGKDGSDKWCGYETDEVLIDDSQPWIIVNDIIERIKTKRTGG